MDTQVEEEVNHLSNEEKTSQLNLDRSPLPAQEQNLAGTHYCRRHKLTQRYGLTLEKYARMLNRQHGVCAICGNTERPLKGKVRPLAVDHDHASGANRGLLCKACNTALGHVEREKWLNAALKYLRKHQ